MALTIPSGIQTEFDAGHIAWSPIVRADFGHGRLRYWADRELGPAVTFDGRTYEARILPVPRLGFDLTRSASITLKIDNTSPLGNPGYARNLIDQGFRMHRARIGICVLYHSVNPPNNVLGSWDSPYWSGSVVSYEIEEEALLLKVDAGFLELNRRHPKFGHSCAAVFRDGLFCGYDPLKGHGLPEARFTGTATGGSTTTLVDSGADFSAVQKGWVIINHTDGCAGRVTAVATTTLTVGSFVNGTDNDFDASDAYTVGPEFASCPNSVPGCQERGMFGVSDAQATGDLNKHQLRWFQGLVRPASVPYRTRASDQRGKSIRLTRTAQGNTGLGGEPIPMIFGAYRFRDIPLLALAPEDENQENPFLNTLWYISMGRCQSVSDVLVDGYPIDDVDRSGAASQKDSLVLYGVEQFSGANDQAHVTSGALTQEQQRLAIASRHSHTFVRNTDLDTYAANPYLFTSTNGSGPSWSNSTLMRVRTQPNGLSRSPRASAFVTGAWCALIPGGTAQVDDGVKTDFTRFPNPIQVLYHYLRYIAGFSDNKLDLPAFRTASDHCQALVSSSQSHQSNVTGIVAWGPNDADTTTTLKNFFVALGEITPGLVGGTVTIQTSGGAVSRIISAITHIPRAPEVDFNPGVGGGFFEVPDAHIGAQIWRVVVSEDFPAGQMPASGDSFTIFSAGSAGSQMRRYKFNGNVELDKPIREVAKAILDNCNGHLTLRNGKIAPVIPTTVDLSTLAGKTIFTDRGSSRRIIRRKGKSTAKWKADAWEDVANEITAEFADKDLNYEVVGRKVYNRESQRYVADAFQESSAREKAAKSLSLNGTNSLDQALRLAALKLRSEGPLPGNRENGTFTCEAALHHTQALQEWQDVHLIQSDVLPQYLGGTPFRLVKKEDDLDKMTSKLTWRPHLNAFYDDGTDDIGVEKFPGGTDFVPGESVIGTKFASLTDVAFVTSQGIFVERVKVSLTLP